MRQQEIGAVPEIGVENRDYHYQSQNATVLGLLVIRGFLNIYPFLRGGVMRCMQRANTKHKSNC